MRRKRIEPDRGQESVRDYPREAQEGNFYGGSTTRDVLGLSKGTSGTWCR
ncbi:MAG: hypothetical protein M3317_14575 [Actinomycetota bacterium]|nr:hypothetical protein [Actinomycetota bacterium]